MFGLDKDHCKYTFLTFLGLEIFVIMYIKSFDWFPLITRKRLLKICLEFWSECFLHIIFITMYICNHTLLCYPSRWSKGGALTGRMGSLTKYYICNYTHILCKWHFYFFMESIARHISYLFHMKYYERKQENESLYFSILCRKRLILHSIFKYKHKKGSSRHSLCPHVNSAVNVYFLRLLSYINDCFHVNSVYGVRFTHSIIAHGSTVSKNQ